MRKRRLREVLQEMDIGSFVGSTRVTLGEFWTSGLWTIARVACGLGRWRGTGDTWSGM